MRRHPLSLPLIAALFIVSACDRVDDLKTRLLGSSSSASDVHPEIQAAESLIEQGRHQEALAKADALIERDPNSAEAFYYRGVSQLALAGEPDPAGLTPAESSALDALGRAVSLNPRHAESYVAIGDLFSRHVPSRAHSDNGEDAEDPYSRAVHAYRQAVTIDPSLAPAQLSYAELLARTGQIELAEEAYRSAAEAAATVPEIAPDYYLAYGRFLAGPGGRLDEAQDQFELARIFRAEDPAIQQELAIIHSRIGLDHFKRQEFLLAQTALEEAVPMFPDPSIPEAQEASRTLEQLRSMRRR